MKINLQTGINELPRIGIVLNKRLLKLGLNNVEDLLFYYPFRYDDFSHIIPIADLKLSVHSTIRGRINIIANKRAFRRKIYITEAIISDDTASIKAVWFNQPFITKLLNQGDEAYFSGKAETTSYGLQLISPSYEKVKKDQTHTARIVPVYSLTENLTTKQLRYLIKLVLPLSQQLAEWIPQDILDKFKLISLQKAIQEIHFPTNNKILAQARNRLKFNELFLIQLKTQAIRQKISQQQAPSINFNQPLTKKFVNALPFTLTASQKQAAWQILRNMHQDAPMNRLLEGDVGSGKTVVAALAMLNVADNHYQAALMAPTEILAQQHYKTIKQVFKNYPIKTALLTRTEKIIGGKNTTKKNITEAIADGQVNIIIGTHALIQEKITFNNLGLVIIDEQHRFGVDQRKLLKQKTYLKNTKQTPHLLSMTATPIPRSLALTLYGDLDLSIISELPQGRKKVMTKIVPPEKRQHAYQFIRDEIKNGRQAFVICPLIEESDKLGVKAATQEHKKLQKNIFSDLNIGLVHGRLKGDEKENVMQDFKKKKIDILVATSVIEVGIDVPNASVMMIEGAERFGLAQLHQFRGRVGRADHQSYCFVFTDSDSEKTINRLKALVESRNGFELAEQDLAFRGPGEIYGLRQSGFPDLKIAKLTDYSIIEQTKQASVSIFKQDPFLDNFPKLREKLDYFTQTIHLE
ncbi:ATP-dependent DNA helicase RecG [Patescibacteria group bacterium]|nr:ATP-dependent DNA helicase RecG [Patescibacteria group bacterium]MBU0964000.1 ATP-dependent DNA helicase RecG [Patescibacteria group bacterium]